MSGTVLLLSRRRRAGCGLLPDSRCVAPRAYQQASYSPREGLINTHFFAAEAAPPCHARLVAAQSRSRDVVLKSITRRAISANVAQKMITTRGLLFRPVFLLIAAFAIHVYGSPSDSPTSSETPTVSDTPSVTQTSTQSPTPSLTPSMTPTSTPPPPYADYFMYKDNGFNYKLTPADNTQAPVYASKLFSYGPPVLKTYGASVSKIEVFLAPSTAPSAVSPSYPLYNCSPAIPAFNKFLLAQFSTSNSARCIGGRKNGLTCSSSSGCTESQTTCVWTWKYWCNCDCTTTYTFHTCKNFDEFNALNWDSSTCRLSIPISNQNLPSVLDSIYITSADNSIVEMKLFVGIRVTTSVARTPDNLIALDSCNNPFFNIAAGSSPNAISATCRKRANAILVTGITADPPPFATTLSTVEGNSIFLVPEIYANWNSSDTDLFFKFSFTAAVYILRGCTSADQVFVDADLADSLSISVANSPCGITLTSTSSVVVPNALANFAAVLRTAQFNTSSKNAVAASLARDIRVSFSANDIKTSTGGFVSVSVTPANDAPSSVFSSVVISEGGPPDFSVVVMSSCAEISVLGLPALCFTDPDPPFLRRDDALDAFSGSSRATSLKRASNYTFTFSSITAFSSSSCSPRVYIDPIGEPIFDCSSSPIDAMTHTNAPIACWWQRFRLRVGNTSASTSVPCRGSSCIIDYESSFCGENARSTPRGLFMNATLTVSDTWAGSIKKVAVLTSIVLSDDVSEPSVVVIPDAPMLSLQNLPVDSVSTTLTIDDRDFSFWSSPGRSIIAPPPLFAICTQNDPGFFGTMRNNLTASLAQFPIEGSIVLPTRQNMNSFFTLTPLTPTLPVSLKDALVCAAALNVSGANAVALDSSGITPWAFMQIHTLRVLPGANLSSIPTRTLTLQVLGADGPPVSVSLTLSRANRPVSFMAPLPVAVFDENDSPGTISTAGVYTVVDDDFEQDVGFSVGAVTLSSCTNISGSSFSVNSPAVPGLFSVRRISRIASIIDYATNSVTLVNTTRTANLIVELDALDIDAPSAAVGIRAGTLDYCIFTLELFATDSGDFSASHSLLPRQIPSVALAVVSIRVNNDALDDAPIFRATAAARVAGLAVAGGESVDLLSNNFGVFAPSTGTPNVFSAWLYGPLGERFFLTNCTVVERRTLMRCTTSAGWGSRAVLAYNTSYGNEAQVPFLAYRAATPIAVSAGGVSPGAWAANLTVGPLTNGTALMITDALAGVKVSNAPASTTFSVLIADLPPSATLNAYARCPLISAALLLDDAASTFLVCGSCVPSTQSPTLGANASVPSATLSRDATLSTSSWWTCPVPSQLSSGMWLRVVIAASFPSSCGGAAVAPSTRVETQSDSISSPLLLKAVSSIAQLTVELQPPSITSVVQSAAGRRFTVCGAHLGSPTTADTSDKIEYANATCTVSPLSCAVHIATQCVYSSAACVECSLDPRGWGAKFHVRAVVRGRASGWSIDVVSYALPNLTSVRVVTSAGATSSSSATLAPGGGTLLLLSGSNLWPPAALTITIGGVRVNPVNLRPPSLASRLSPYCELDSCYGGEHLLWRDADSNNATSLLVAAPPGIGNVSIAIALGDAVSRMTINYAAMVFKRVIMLRGSISEAKFTMLATVSGLSPCALCFSPSGTALNSSIDGTNACAFAKTMSNTLIEAARTPSNSRST